MRDLVATDPRISSDGGRFAWLFTALRLDGFARWSRKDWSTEPVLWKRGEIEVRRAPHRQVVETLVRGDAEGARSTGTQRLEAYVFGANAQNALLPAGGFISQEQMRDGLWRVWLCLRDQTDMGDIPVPTNPKVRISVQPSREIAVVRFIGYPTRDLVTRVMDQLTRALVGTVWRCSGAWRLRAWGPLGLNLPFRRIELAVTLARESGTRAGLR